MIRVICNQETFELPQGSTAADFASKLKNSYYFAGVVINDRIKDLTTTLEEGDNLRFVTFSDPEGREIFLHTSAHILAQAVLRLWPNALPTIGPVIDQGFYYDFANLSISEDDFDAIEKMAEQIAQERHAVARKIFCDKNEALKKFGHNPFKVELIKELPDGELITSYSQGEFIDLCRGPHLPSTAPVKAFKLLRTSAAYWRGDPQRDSLVRIYGIAFPTAKELKEHLYQLEEAKKRDHRVLGVKLDLFSQQECSAGMPFFHPRGMIIWDALIGYWKRLHQLAGYKEIQTPQLMNRSLWEVSGHWTNYKENMYTLQIDDEDYAIKPMNCPGCMLYYKTRLHSYKEFPLRIAEIGHVHRYEISGALSGLMRVRAFHQDDAHVFLTPEQVEEETLNILNLVSELYKTFGLDYHLELSTKPEKDTIGSDELWELATSALQRALTNSKTPFFINPGDGAFYGPKIDIHVKDAIQRTWQCGTIQLDMFLPERFALEYTNAQGEKSTPIMLHRALFGSIERFLGILIEHFKGKFPLWLSPEHIRIITVADRHQSRAHELFSAWQQLGFVVTVDDSNESVSKKIRNAQNMQVNYMVTIGDREVEEKTLAVRTRDNRVLNDMTVERFINTLLDEKNSLSLTPLL